MAILRKDVKKEDKWNLELLYQDFALWEKDLALVSLVFLEQFKGKLSSETALCSFLDAFFDAQRKVDKLYTYAHLRHDEELNNDIAKNAYERVSTLAHLFSEKSAWIAPELLSIDSDRFEAMIQSASLKKYHFYLEKLQRRRAHTLSPQEELLLALAAKPMDAAHSAFSALNNIDLKFPSVKDSRAEDLALTHATYSSHLRSSDRLLRKDAFEKMHAAFAEKENTIAELLRGEIESHVFYAKARKHPSSLDAALFPHQIDAPIYHSLIKNVRAHIGSLHKYMRLRKKLLKVEELHLYDVYAPLVPDVAFSYSYQEAEDLVIESVKELGEEYQEALRDGLKTKRWADRYENVAKRSGAYSSGCYDSSPFILMNFEGKLGDMMTLAHEAGHSMHSFLSNKNQDYVYHKYPIFLAEIASTFNEELLFDLLMKKEKGPRLAFLISQKLDDMRATFFRQTMFAEFELSLHTWAEQGIPLTPKFLKEQYLQLNRDYFGPDMVVDEQIAIEWARIPHFYYNFYVYQYATGLSAASSFFEQLKVDRGALDRYLGFLKAGGSKYPLDILKEAGVDLASEGPVLAMIKRFDLLSEKLEQIMLT